MDAAGMAPKDRQDSGTAPPSAANPAKASHRYAITALVLGITSNLLLVGVLIAFFESFDESELDAWIWITYLTTLVGAICALLFGAEGRRQAKDGPGWVMATIGWVLGIVFIVASIVCLILTLFIAAAISRDTL